LIGKEISEERTVRVHGHFNKHYSDLLPGMFFSSVIEAGSEKVQTLPIAAFVSFEEGDFIFTKSEKNSFHLLQVKKGNCHSGRCGFNSEASLEGKDIVVKGSYELMGLMKNTEE